VKKDHELAGIEILRFVCALGVLIWHYQHFFFRGAWNAELGAALRPTLPLYSVFFIFYENGSLAVPFFWVISGFIFYWQYSAAVRSGAVKFRDFLVRRFSRLYPLHFVTLVLVALGQYVYFESHRETFIYSWNKPIWFASQLLFASNWFTRQPETFNGPIWSVSIEIVIYLLFFAIARAFGPRALVAMSIAAVCSISFNFLHSFINPDVFACGMYFFAGGIAQRLSVRPASLQIAGFAAALTLAVLIFGHYRLNAVYLLLLAMSFVIIMTKLGEAVLRVPFRHLAFLGNATYSSYLLHFPVQLLFVILVDAIGWSRDIFYSPIAFIVYLAGVVGLSLIVHRYFEMPAQSFIRILASSLFARSSVVRVEDSRSA
jgi:peptidoglycan/LPS O-acetylase OafA/YrhL